MRKISGITILAYIIAGLIGIYQTVRVANFVHPDLSDAFIGFFIAFTIAGFGYLYNKDVEKGKTLVAIEDYLAELPALIEAEYQKKDDKTEETTNQIEEAKCKCGQKKKEHLNEKCFIRINGEKRYLGKFIDNGDKK